MKKTFIPMILITLLLFTGCSHRSHNPPIQKPPLSTTQKVAGTAGGLLLGTGGALVGGMMGMLVSGGTNGVAPLIGVILGGVTGTLGGASLGIGVGGTVD